MPVSRRAVIFGLAMFGAGCLIAAADDFAQKAVTAPGLYWTIWGNAKTHLVAASQAGIGAAQRVIVTPRPTNPWDVGTYAPITRPVRRGDVIVLSFWGRAEKPPAGSDLVLLSGRIYEAGPGGANVTPEGTFLVGKQWKHYFLGGTAARDYPIGSLSAGVFLGTGEQIVDFGTVSVLDFGPGFDLNSLPRE